jgi:hypothetical protein
VPYCRPAEEESVRGGCHQICQQRQGEAAAARKALQEVQDNRSATVAAAELDANIKTAQRDVEDTSRQKSAAKDVNPQATSIGKATGLSGNIVALVGQVMIAILVEIGSGFLPWALFGHGKREENPELLLIASSCHHRLQAARSTLISNFAAGEPNAKN